LTVITCEDVLGLPAVFEAVKLMVYEPAFANVMVGAVAVVLEKVTPVDGLADQENVGVGLPLDEFVVETAFPTHPVAGIVNAEVGGTGAVLHKP
jgi:hypothetical protein